MSAFAIVSALSWAAVVWLVVVHVLVERGRATAGGALPLTAMLATTASLVAGAWVTGFWPMLALGLLWLRSDLLARHSGTHRRHHSAAEIEESIERVMRPAMSVLFKIEVAAVVIVLLVLFGKFSQHQRATFDQRSDRVLCGLLNPHC